MELLRQRAKAVLKLRKVLRGCLADVIFQGNNGFANEVSQALGRLGKNLGRRLDVTQRYTNILECVVRAEGVNGLLPVDGDLVAGNLELDLASHQQCRNKVSECVL